MISVELFVGVALFLLLCHLGRLFARLVFVYAIERTTTRLCFSIVFALSTFIFALTLLDASRVRGLMFSVGFSTSALRLALIAHLLALLLLCPACLVWSLLQDLRLRRRATPAYLALLFVGLVCLVCLTGVWRQVLEAVRQLWGVGVGPLGALWEAAIAAVACVGVVVVGLLSGFAAITTPVAFILPFVRKKSLDDARSMLRILAKRQRHLLSLWEAKQRQIAESTLSSSSIPFYSFPPSTATTTAAATTSTPTHTTTTTTTTVPITALSSQRGLSSNGASSAPRVWGWVAKSLRSTMGGGSANTARLQAESDGIHAVSRAVFLQMSEMGSLVRSAESASTWRGRVDFLLGVILLIHTLLKVSFTVISLVRWGASTWFAADTTPSVDTATRLVMFLESYGLATPHRGADGTEDRVVWVSLILNAWMIISSIRGFLLTLFRLLMTYTGFVSVDSTVLVLTTGMGAYFLGQLLLLRLSPTLEQQSVLSAVLQEHLPRGDSYRQLNDAVFVFACGLTIVFERCFLVPFESTLEELSG